MPLRQRIAPVVVAAGIGGALLAPGTALAGTSTVTFNGGCGLLGVGASTQPSTGTLTVVPGSTVTFVNHLGRSAQLMINGAGRGSVPADEQVSVLFRQGRAVVSMLPSCVLESGAPGSVTITVTPVASRSSSPSAVAGPSDEQSTLAGRSPEARTTTKAAPGISVLTPADPLAPRLNGGLPPLEDPGMNVSTDPAAPSLDAVAAVSAAEPAPPARRGAAGLLVFVAAICVAGVSIAATRAIIAQRAIRTLAL